MESVKVIIVGGGAAGLGAAKTLGSDVNYLLIEAQNYLGGRIYTVDAGCFCFLCYLINLYLFFPVFNIKLVPNVIVDLVTKPNNYFIFLYIIHVWNINRVLNLFMEKQIILFMKFVNH
jgi:hypothetical protein